MTKDRSRILNEVSKNSLLEIVPGMSELLLEKGEVRLITAGSQVAKQGAPIEHLILPLSESLRLVYGSPGGGESFIGYLQKYRSLGLKEILENKNYGYAAVAETATTVLLLPKDAFVQLLRQNPRVEHYLRLITSSSGLRTFKNLLSERGVQSSLIFEIFYQISATTFLLKQGQSIDFSEPALYFIKSGYVKVMRSPGNDVPAAAIDIGEGAFFGGEALVEPNRVSYTAVAGLDTVLHYSRLSQISGLLKDAGIVDFLYEEPWLKSDGNEAEAIENSGSLTALPGQVLTQDEIFELRLQIDPADIRIAKTDNQSFLTSISNIGKMIGLRLNLASIQNELFSNARGISPLKLAEALEPFGLYLHVVSTNLEELYLQHLPGLIMLGPRLCVLLKRERGRVIVHDPARGVITLSDEVFERHWDKLLIEVYKPETDHVANEFDEKLTITKREDGTTVADMAAIKSTIFKYFYEFKGILLNVFGLSVVYVGLNLLTPVFTQHILDEVLTLRDQKMLWVFIIGLVLTMLFGVVITVVKQSAMNEFSVRFDQKLSALFYRQALGVPSTFFSNQRVGEILARLDEVQTIRGFFSGPVMDTTVSIISIVGYAASLAMYSGKIAAVAMLLLVITILLRLGFKSYIKRRYDRAFDADARASSVLTEQIGTISTIKAAGAEDLMRRRWEAAWYSGMQSRSDVTVLSNRVQGLISFLSLLTQTFGLYTAATMAMNGEISPGAVMAVNMYMGGLIGPIGSISGIFTQIENVKVAFEKLAEVFAADMEQSPTSAVVSHSMSIKGKIRFDRVSFRYESNAPWVLKDIDLTVYPNQVVAIVGRSGCGKTTLANLIAGNRKPTTGRIYFDGFDSSFLSVNSLRRQIGFIMQRNDLFAGSIGENIAYTDDAPDVELVKKASIDANAAAFISKFPGGFDHYLAEGGLGLSGGQRQRVSIARSLYRTPKILLLDEATSALDAASERAIIENMKEILAGKTAIVIAHRLSTIRNADRIIVMKDGEIVEEGTHTSLIRAGGHYGELFENQIAIGEA